MVNISLIEKLLLKLKDPYTVQRKLHLVKNFVDIFY